MVLFANHFIQLSCFFVEFRFYQLPPLHTFCFHREDPPSATLRTSANHSVRTVPRSSPHYPVGQDHISSVTVPKAKLLRCLAAANYPSKFIPLCSFLSFVVLPSKSYGNSPKVPALQKAFIFDSNSCCPISVTSFISEVFGTIISSIAIVSRKQEATKRPPILARTTSFHWQSADSWPGMIDNHGEPGDFLWNLPGLRWSSEQWPTGETTHVQIPSVFIYGLQVFLVSESFPSEPMGVLSHPMDPGVLQMFHNFFLPIITIYPVRPIQSTPLLMMSPSVVPCLAKFSIMQTDIGRDRNAASVFLGSSLKHIWDSNSHVEFSALNVSLLFLPNTFH